MIPGLNFASKLAPQVLVGVAIATGIVLFIPEGAATLLGVDAFRTEFRGYLGWSFILSIALFGSWAVEAFILSKKRKRENAAKKTEELAAEQHKKEQEEAAAKKEMEAHQEMLHELTGEEKEFVAPYVFQDTTAQYADLESGIVRSLLHKSVLMPPNGVGSIFSWALNIQPWALKYLKEHPELLAGYENSEPRRRSRY